MFKEMFTEAFSKQFHSDREARSTDHNHPSEMTACTRKFWYKVNKVPISNEPSVSMKLIWKQGHALQSVMEELLPLIPDIEEYVIEKELGDEEHNLGGHCDLVVKVRGKWYVLDFKTAGVTKFKEVQGKKGVPIAYRWQVNQYIHMLKKKDPEKYESLDSAILLFINKSPVPDEIFLAQNKPRLVKSPFYEVLIQYDPDLLETEILPQAEYLEEVRGMEEPPDRSDDEQECVFCEYRSLCKGVKTDEGK